MVRCHFESDLDLAFKTKDYTRRRLIWKVRPDCLKNDLHFEMFGESLMYQALSEMVAVRPLVSWWVSR